MDETALTQEEITAAAEYEAEERTRLQKGELALTHEHYYYFYDDVFDVYLAQRRPLDDEHAFWLIACNPLIDSEAEIMKRSPTLAIAADGALVVFTPTGPERTRYSSRDLQPFGIKQAKWYAEYAATSDDDSMIG
ncbi:MAG TPA: hypothetical protein PLW39_07320 [Thermoflexales bacterium]|nr:hypothetical protein [Thermoflexales bacterium]HQW35941.1 hypothetical protein [Thermoflexales bacterium]HQZ22063.1 hypothetical protein [Thermoflexales bacterium]